MEEEEQSRNKAVYLQTQGSAWTSTKRGAGLRLHLQRHWDRKSEDILAAASSKRNCLGGNYFLFPGSIISAIIQSFSLLPLKARSMISCVASGSWPFKKQGLNTTSSWQTLTTPGILLLLLFFLNSEFKSQQWSWAAWRRSTAAAVSTGMTQRQKRRDMAAQRQGAAKEQPQAAWTKGTLSDPSEFRRWLYKAPLVRRTKLIFGKRKTLNSEQGRLFRFWVLAYSFGHYFQTNPHVHGNRLDCGCICPRLPLCRKRRHCSEKRWCPTDCVMRKRKLEVLMHQWREKQSPAAPTRISLHTNNWP